MKKFLFNTVITGIAAGITALIRLNPFHIIIEMDAVFFVSLTTAFVLFILDFIQVILLWVDPHGSEATYWESVAKKYYNNFPDFQMPFNKYRRNYTQGSVSWAIALLVSAFVTVFKYQIVW